MHVFFLEILIASAPRAVLALHLCQSLIKLRDYVYTDASVTITLVLIDLSSLNDQIPPLWKDKPPWLARLEFFVNIKKSCLPV
jgi:hypothetical protein